MPTHAHIFLAGHTMATPELSLGDATRLIAELDLDGIEVIVDNDYRCGLTTDATETETRALANLASDLGLRIAGLVPYTHDLDHSDGALRSNAVDELCRTVDLANRIGAPGVRVLAGSTTRPDSDRYAALIDSLNQVTNQTRGSGVSLNIENHPNTHATTSKNTLGVLKDADTQTLGVLYDPVNLELERDPQLDKSFALQQASIKHVHVKDFSRRSGETCATVVGNGESRIAVRIAEIANSDYAGFLSFEYERRWQPDVLPPAALGLPPSIRFVRTILADGCNPRES